METLTDFLNWAWARHQNPLSWYIRPLFILPFCYFAYKKNIWGMLLTVVAIASSMFWFPTPTGVDPRAAAFLDVERQYITGGWTFGKIVVTALIPIWFVALWWAIRRHSWLVAGFVIGVGTLLKVGWSFWVAGETAWTIIPPIALGTAICAGALLLAHRRVRERVE